MTTITDVTVDTTEANFPLDEPVEVDAPLDSPEDVTVPVEPTEDTPTPSVDSGEPEESEDPVTGDVEVEPVEDKASVLSRVTEWLNSDSIAQVVTLGPANGAFVALGLLVILIVLAAVLGGVIL